MPKCPKCGREVHRDMAAQRWHARQHTEREQFTYSRNYLITQDDRDLLKSFRIIWPEDVRDETK